MLIIKTILLNLVLLLLPISIYASGIQVSPARLDLQAPARTTGQLTVANPTADTQTFQIYAEDYPGAILAEPNDFALEPGGRRTVMVRVDAKRLSAEIQNQTAAPFVTSLDVLARPLDKKNLAIAAGVKIPLTASLPPLPRSTANQNLAALLAATLGFVWLGWLIFRKRLART